MPAQTKAQQAKGQPATAKSSRFTTVPVEQQSGASASPAFDPTPCYDLDVQELGGPAPLVLALLDRLADCYNMPDLVLPPELVPLRYCAAGLYFSGSSFRFRRVVVL